MKRVDPYLTNKAQARYPTAEVYCSLGSWYMDRGPRYELVSLGASFHEARAALRVILRAEAARAEEDSR